MSININVYPLLGDVPQRDKKGIELREGIEIHMGKIAVTGSWPMAECALACPCRLHFRPLKQTRFPLKPSWKCPTITSNMVSPEAVVPLEPTLVPDVASETPWQESASDW
jgi:hypothetical protein